MFMEKNNQQIRLKPDMDQGNVRRYSKTKLRGGIAMKIDETYFPGFTQKWIETEPGIVINTLIGGSGKEAVLLLHGHPDTHLMWRFLTPELVKHYTVVITDLRGYGDSSKPEGLPDHSNYSKRAMADDQVKVMQALGFDRFHVAGHDRGARVLHRMIIDHPEKIRSCTLMDIVATYDMYKDTNEEFATKYWHWFFYIQGKGFPETALSADPDRFINYNLNLKIGPAARANFPPDVLAEYTRCFSDIRTVHGICEDYRASATIDMQLDEPDRKKKIETPLLLLWGQNGVVGKLWNVMEKWEPLACNIEGEAIPQCGHFVPEEQPELVLKRMLPFLAKHSA